MPIQPASPAALRFADFVLDLRTGELRRDGALLKLQPQPSKVLTVLVSRAGEVVTRQELAQEVWGSETFVDFEQGLNFAVRQIRSVLGDDADHPVFLETVPKRGYRFLVPVNGLDLPPAGTLDPTPKAESLKSRPWLSRAISTCVFAALVCLSLVLYFHRRETTVPPTNERAEFKVIPFTALPGEERSPTFSPDGSQIAFAWKQKEGGREHKFDIYVKVTGSENLLQITHHPADAIRLAWSPDGSQIAFQRTAGAEGGIYLVPALGGPERRLRSTSAELSGLSWSPDGHWIAFADSSVVGGGHSLKLISVDSLETKPIPHIAECQEETYPAFSPDGEELAYVCIPQSGRFAIYGVNLTTGAPHLIGRYAGWSGGFVWSRDKQRLVIARHPQGNKLSELDEISASDGQLRKLPFGEAGERPAISNGGDKLTFETWHFTGADIWKRALIPPGGRAEKIIASTQGSIFPQYSADRKHVTFMSDLTGVSEIWMSNADGTGLLQISKLNNGSTGSPHWSPDGRRVAFDSRIEGRSSVYIADIEERVPRRLRSNIEEMSQPFWSHDGRWIYFIGGANSARIYRCPAEGGKAEALSSQAGSFPQESFDGDKVYFVTVLDNPTLKVISLKKPDSESTVESMPSVNFANWAVGPQGIYFLPNHRLSLEFFDFSTKKVSRLMELSDEVVMGFSVSQDQRSIVYGRLQQADSDIMVVENWR